MLLQRSSSRKPDRVKIIDWELAQLGDPCWDVGVFFSEYLSVWLASIPFSQKMALDQSLNLARFPLSKMQPAIQAFWKAYVLSLKLDSIAVTNRLLRATQYAGLRLVQTAYERLQNQSSITPLDIYILQLCVNLVTRPVEAVIHLLGLPWWE
jgi:Predicted choline kinase involved in LPS biosynthesis